MHMRVAGNWKGKQAVAAIAVVLLAGIGVAYYKVTHSEAHIQQNDTVAAVSRLAVLPTDETPSVTSVVDKTQLSQPFLQDAENGDQVLLYFQSGRAVVYRPSSGKIVNMGPLEVPKPRVFIRNGTSSSVPTELVKRISDSGEFNLVSQDVSAKKDYGQTVVVDVAGNRPDAARKLAALLGAKVVDLPENESRPDADVMVIAGADVD